MLPVAVNLKYLYPPDVYLVPVYDTGSGSASEYLIITIPDPPFAPAIGVT